MTKIYIDAFLKPKETFAAEKSKASLGKSVVNILIAGLISGVLSFLFSFVLGAALSSIMPAGGKTGLGLAFGAFGVIITPIIVVAVTLVAMGVYFLLAKLLGGTGSYTSLLYLYSLYAPAVALLSAIPIIGILVSLYAIYLFFLALKESQGLSTGKAIAVILIPVVVFFVLALIALVLGIAFLLPIINSITGSIPTA